MTDSATKPDTDDRKAKLREVIMRKSYVVANGRVTPSDPALSAKIHEARLAAKARL